MNYLILILIAETAVIAILVGIVAWFVFKGYELVIFQYASRAIGKFELMASKNSSDLIGAHSGLVDEETKPKGN